MAEARGIPAVFKGLGLCYPAVLRYPAGRDGTSIPVPSLLFLVPSHHHLLHHCHGENKLNSKGLSDGSAHI